MPHVMSHEYPAPPSHNGADMNVPIPGYYSVHRHQQQQVSGMDDREGRGSYPNLSQMKHYTSTPSVQAHETYDQPLQHASLENAESDQSELSLAAAEKRRNKLGYHRTSVACGHCRKRKIRCIPSPNDVQARCINCIRLKKDCSFFPVDQQPPINLKQRSTSRSSTGPKVTSTSPSPAMQSGIPQDPRGQQGYPQPALPSIQTMAPPMKMSGTESFTPTTYGTSVMTNWMSVDDSPSTSKSDDMRWRYPGETPATPAASAYSAYPGQLPEPSWDTSVSGESSTREDMTWSGYEAPPVRPLSYSSDSMGSQQAHYASVSGRPYVSPLATTIPAIETVPNSMEHQVALSAGAVASPGYQTWPQYQYAKPSGSYTTWYGEPEQHQSADRSDEHPAHGSSMY